MRYVLRRTMFGLLLAGASALTAAPGRLHGVAVGFSPDWLFPLQAAEAEEIRGQTYWLLEVSRRELIRERAKALFGEIRTRLRGAGIAYDGLVANDRVLEVRIGNAADIEPAKAALADLVPPVDTAETAVSEVSFDEPQPGLLAYTLTEEGIAHRVERAAEGSIPILHARLSEFTTARRIVRRQDPDRIVVEINGLHDLDRLRLSIAKRARLTLQWVDGSTSAEQALAGQPPEGSSVLYSADRLPFLIEDRVIVSGDNLRDAEVRIDEVYDVPVVGFRFDEEGTRLFGEATRQNVGRALAIILDDQVLSAPVVREPILGGTGQISGNFTRESADELVILLRSKALPATLNLIQERFLPADP